MNAKVVTAMPALSETKKRRVKLVHCQRPMGPMWPRMASKSTFEKEQLLILQIDALELQYLTYDSDFFALLTFSLHSAEWSLAKPQLKSLYSFEVPVMFTSTVQS